MPAVGEVYRDTTYDKPPRPGSKSYHNFDPAFYAGLTKRTVRIIEPVDPASAPKRRWLVQSVTDHRGDPIENGRRTKVSEATLAASYELVTCACEHAVALHYDLGCIGKKGGSDSTQPAGDGDKFCKCVAAWRDGPMASAAS